MNPARRPDIWDLYATEDLRYEIDEVLARAVEGSQRPMT